ncbi:MAG: phosphoenolpyruvate carboxykinase [Armatimonadota bacterium]
MWNLPGEVTERAVTIYMTGQVCTQPAQIFQSEHAPKVIQNFINDLRRRESSTVDLFEAFDSEGDLTNPSPAARMLAKVLGLLVDLEPDDIEVRAPDCAPLLEDVPALAELVEDLYDHWRSYERYLMLESSADDSRDSSIEGHMPFIYNNQDLTQLVRDGYRRIERNLRGHWPRVYRQTPGGANMSLLVETINWDCPGGVYEQLQQIRMVRLALLTPPVVLYPRSTHRSGKFVEVDTNPLQGLRLEARNWFSIPLLVGDQRFHVYFDRDYLAQAVSLVNLFELSGHEEARERPDAIVVFGIPPEQMGDEPTIFHYDEEHDIAVGAVVKGDEMDYFGYFKKMMLTLHNVIQMRRGRLPIHGAMVKLKLRQGPETGIVIVGDSGAGKSETLEAFRELADEWISDMTVIFDDMGSLLLEDDNTIRGFGTEIGAFLRLDDLAPGYAFGRFDRSIFMNPQKHNARVVLPITDYGHITAGYPVSMLLYANNYEPVTESTPILEFFRKPEQSIEVFRSGYRAAKGTTDERGLVHTYFANPFGPDQKREMHEPLAQRYFAAAHEGDIRVGELRTRLGIEGMEREGPAQAAEALFEELTDSE